MSNDRPRLTAGLRLCLAALLGMTGCQPKAVDLETSRVDPSIKLPEGVPEPGSKEARENPGEAPQVEGGGAVPRRVDTTAQGAPPPGGDRIPGTFEPAQIQQAVRGFADQYRQMLGTAIDNIIAESDDPRVRQRAHRAKIQIVTAMYDIAVDPVPVSAMINAIVLVSIQANYLRAHASKDYNEDVKEYIARVEFLQEEAFRIAAQFMSNQKRRELLQLINQWSAQNHDVRNFYYVRLDDLPGVQPGVDVNTLVGSITGLPAKFINIFNPFAAGQQSVNEAQVLAERMSWLAPRLMILAQWRAEAILYDTLANPQVMDTLGAVERFAVVAETLPQTLDAQREAFFNDLKENQGNISALLNDTQQLTNDATQLFTQVDSIMARVQDMQAKSLEAEAGKPPRDPNEPKGPPFDINDYTEAIRELDELVVNANTLLQTADDATSDAAIEARLDVVQTTATRLILIAAGATLGVGLLIVLAVKFIPPRRRA